MHLLVINFKAENTAEEYDKATAEIAPVFAEIEGLIIKHFLFNHEEKTYGGCYQFESKAALDAYMAGDVFKMIMENPIQLNQNKMSLHQMMMMMMMMELNLCRGATTVMVKVL